MEHNLGIGEYVYYETATKEVKDSMSPEQAEDYVKRGFLGVGEIAEDLNLAGRPGAAALLLAVVALVQGNFLPDKELGALGERSREIFRVHALETDGFFN